jgi:uncharacterized integral membrane protein
MNIEIILSSILLLSIFIGTVRMYLFHKQNEGLFIGLVSMASIIFGLFLILIEGIQFDYDLNYFEVHQNSSPEILIFGKANVVIGLLFIFHSVAKYIVWRIRRD